jgi:hypothetical protein
MVRRLALVVAATFLIAGAAFAKNDALSLVPADAVTVGMVKLSELRTSPLSGFLFQHTDKITADGEGDRFLDDAGLDLTKDVDVLVVATSPKTRFGNEPEIVVIADGRFNVERLTKALLARGAVKKDSYFTFPESENNDRHQGAVAFPSASLAIVGSESAVVEALAARANGGTGWLGASALGQDASRIDPSANAWAVVDVTRSIRLSGKTRVPNRNDASGQALQAAIKSVSTVALWGTDTGDSLKLGAFGLTSDTDTLMLLEDTLRGALAAARLAVKDKQPDLVSVLRRFQVERTDNSVRITGTIPGESIRKLLATQHAEK